MAQTKADRQAAAKKAAATRQRNRVRTESQSAGKKAASTRQKNEALSALSQAQTTAKGAFSSLGNAARTVGVAAVQAGKSVTNRGGGAKR